MALKCWGFARSFISEGKKDNSRQIDKLIEAGADDVVFEYDAVNTGEKRPFRMLLEMTQPGDTIMALELCRMCSSSQEFCQLIQEIQALHLRLLVVDCITVDCRTQPYDAATAAFLQLATSLYELDESKRYKKCAAAATGVRKQRKSIGRPRTSKEDIPQCFFMYYPLYDADRISASEFARLCSLSRPTIYKYLKIVRNNV